MQQAVERVVHVDDIHFRHGAQRFLWRGDAQVCQLDALRLHVLRETIQIQRGLVGDEVDIKAHRWQARGDAHQRHAQLIHFDFAGAPARCGGICLALNHCGIAAEQSHQRISHSHMAFRDFQ